eukprot:6180238-Pleurochrysis_carterae.AAC.1
MIIRKERIEAVLNLSSSDVAQVVDLKGTWLPGRKSTACSGSRMAKKSASHRGRWQCTPRSRRTAAM